MAVGAQRQAPAVLPPGKTRYPSIGGWVGPRAGLDGFGKSRHNRDSIPGPSSLQPVAIPTELSRPTDSASNRSKYQEYSLGEGGG
jgi:hypothetical protein